MVDQSETTANQARLPHFAIEKTLSARYRFRRSELINDLYNRKKLSAREIAALLGCAHSSINRALEKFKVLKSKDIRRPSYGRPSPKKAQSVLSLEVKRQAEAKKYLARGLSLSEIARRFNSRNYATPSGRGFWTAAAIRRITSPQKTSLWKSDAST